MQGTLVDIESVPSFKDRLSQINYLQSINPIYYDESKIYWVWDHKTQSYQMCDETDVLNVYRYVLKDEHILKSKIKAEVLEGIRQTGRENEITPPDSNYIQFKNTVVDIESGDKFMATPEYFWTNPIPHNLGESTSTPTIDKLFIDWVGKDNKMMLYEILAYTIYKNYPIHVIFALFGSGRNGKSQFNKIVEKLVGKHNICATSLESIMKSRFETSRMYKKHVAFISETDNSTVMRGTATLKALSGGDSVSGEMKNKTPFEFINHAKIIIATNNLPSAYDESVGYASRWIIVDFPNQFKGGKPIVNSIPEYEYENLCNKLIIILPKLLERGSFTGEKSSQEKAIALQRGANPLLAFIDERFTEDDNGEITGEKFITEFKTWIKECSINYEVLNRKLYPELKKLGFQIERLTKQGRKHQIIYGLNLKTYDPTKTKPKPKICEYDFYDDENMTNPFDGQETNGGYLQPSAIVDYEEQLPPTVTEDEINQDYQRSHTVKNHEADEW